MFIKTKQNQPNKKNHHFPSHLAWNLSPLLSYQSPALLILLSSEFPLLTASPSSRPYDDSLHLYTSSKSTRHISAAIMSFPSLRPTGVTGDNPNLCQSTAIQTLLQPYTSQTFLLLPPCKIIYSGNGFVLNF